MSFFFEKNQDFKVKLRWTILCSTIFFPSPFWLANKSLCWNLSLGNGPTRVKMGNSFHHSWNSFMALIKKGGMKSQSSLCEEKNKDIGWSSQFPKVINSPQKSCYMKSMGRERERERERERWVPSSQVVKTNPPHT